MCPLYVSGLIGPGDRKSAQQMAKRLAIGACGQLHHFIAVGVWAQRLCKPNYFAELNRAARIAGS